jgi:hypothetical protein
MSDAINIQDIQTLYDLQNALSRFASGTQESLHAAEAEIARTQEWLEERMQHWRREAGQAKRMLDQAMSDLRRCEASGYRDEDGHYHQPDCGREAQAVRRAGERLHECEENLQTTQAWRSRVEQAVTEYQREARRLSDLVGGHSEKAHGELGKAAATYEAAKEAAGSVGVAGVVAAAGVAILRQFIGQAHGHIGATGEEIAQDMAEKSLGYENVEFDRTKHGFDRILRDPSGQLVILESKTNVEGKLELNTDSGQGSSEWVSRIAHEMTDPSSSKWSQVNEQIGREILQIGPENIPLIATVTNPNTGLGDIYTRVDVGAKEWALLSGGISLKDLL